MNTCWQRIEFFEPICRPVSRALCIGFQNFCGALGIFSSHQKTESARERHVWPLTTAIITGNHAINPECL